MQTAKLFNNGRSQAVRLPAAFRFEGGEVFIRRDEKTGDVILSKHPSDWAGFIGSLQAAGVETDTDPFVRQPEDAAPNLRDPFEGWPE